jgi:hypothetical protein
MSEFEQKLREDFARRAEQMPVTPDLADLQTRIDRVEVRRDTRFNAAALLGAAAVVVLIVGLAVMMTRSEPVLVSSVTPTTVPRLADAVKQRLAITAAFDRVFESATPDAARLAGIMDNAGLEAVAYEMRTRDQGHLLDTVKVHVDAVQFVPPSLANVDFAITSTKIKGRTPFPGQAVRDGSEWKISRATFCTVVGKVGVQCPPVPTTTTNPA